MLSVWKELPMSESLIINPHSGQPMTAEPTKYKIHDLELPFLIDDVKKMMPNCMAVSIQQTPQGPQPAVGPGFDASAAVVFLETARALAEVRKRLDDLEEENRRLEQHLKEKNNA